MKPLTTLAATALLVTLGQASAAGSDFDVLVSRGIYMETVSLETGVGVYGGYDAAADAWRAAAVIVQAIWMIETASIQPPVRTM